MKNKRIEELKQMMDRSAEAIKHIIDSAPTPEIRHKLATEHLKWVKERREFFDTGEHNGNE